MSDSSNSSTAAASSSSTYMLVPILLLFLLLIIAVLRSPNLITSAGIGSAVIVLTPLALATFSLMVLAMAGRGTVDLSVGPLIGFINVTLVVLSGTGALESPVAFFLYAAAVGVIYQLIVALIIIYVRVQPIIVALSGYLALSGINLVILPRPGGTAPEWMSSWGLGTTIFSPILLILVLATALWLIFTSTAFYGHLRLMGSDERAAYTSGVRITIVRLGAHIISGLFAALAALTYTALIGSGDPTQGTTYTLISVTALVLGGTSLSGGRGGVIGSLMGAVNLFLIGYVLATFNFGAVQGFVTDLAYGVILVLSLLLTVAIPWLQRRIPNISPTIVFVVLSIAFAGVILHAKYDYSQLVVEVINKTQVIEAPISISKDSLSDDASNAVATSTSSDQLARVTSSVNSQIEIPSVPDLTDKTEIAQSTAAGSLIMQDAIRENPVIKIVSTDFFFENKTHFGEADSVLAKPVALGLLWAIVLLIVARATVLQTRLQKFSPRMIYIVFAALVVSIFMAWDNSVLPNAVKQPQVSSKEAS